MKKLVCLLLALLICMGSFASCKKPSAAPNGNAPVQTEGNVTEQEKETEATTEPAETKDKDSEGSVVEETTAGDTEFTPSVTYKNGPVVITASLEGQNVKDCIVVTNIEQAKKKTTDITQGERDLLVEVYEKLVSGEMNLPIEGEYVIRDLVDISFEYADCRQQQDHGNKDEIVARENTLLTLDLDLDIAQEEKMAVYAYVDGQWEEIPNVINNGNGSVTGSFENVCPVAFVVLK